MALWKLYGGATESVAITTTVERLQSAAPTWGKLGRVDVKKVRYIDHAGPVPNGVFGLDESVFGLKHVAYSFEKEVRIILTRSAPKRRLAPPAIRVPVNLDRFLRSVIVAPDAGEWFFDLVADLAQRYKVIAPVRRSKLTSLLERAGARHR
jgi:hypothetical protein